MNEVKWICYKSQYRIGILNILVQNDFGLLLLLPIEFGREYYVYPDKNIASLFQTC